MKLAVSGAHRTGKTTLVGDLADSLPLFSTVEEPYYQLLEEGHIFAELPDSEDFELQLERSIASLEGVEKNVLFDRCPYDIIAYLITLDGFSESDPERWLQKAKVAIQSIDLVIFVPIEEPDRIPVEDSGYADLRLRVDRELREIVLDDRFDLLVPAIEVQGSPGDRVRQVLAAIRLK